MLCFSNVNKITFKVRFVCLTRMKFSSKLNQNGHKEGRLIFTRAHFYDAIYKYMYRLTGKPQVDLPFFISIPNFNPILEGTGGWGGGSVLASCPLHIRLP